MISARLSKRPSQVITIPRLGRTGAAGMLSIQMRMRSKIFCCPAIRLKQGTFAPWHDSDVRTRTGSLISLITLPKQIDAWPKASLIWPARFVACFPLQAGQSRRSRDRPRADAHEARVCEARHGLYVRAARHPKVQKYGRGFVEPLVRVEQSSDQRSAGKIGPCKNVTAYRTVLLHDPEGQKAMRRLKRFLGPATSSHALVFRSKRGGSLREDTWQMLSMEPPSSTPQS